MLDIVDNDGIQRQACSLADRIGFDIEHTIDGYDLLLRKLAADISGGHEDSTEFTNVARYVCVHTYRLADSAIKQRVAANALGVIHALGLLVGDVEDMSDLGSGHLARVKSGTSQDLDPTNVVYVANELDVPMSLLFEDFDDKPELLRSELMRLRGLGDSVDSSVAECVKEEVMEPPVVTDVEDVENQPPEVQRPDPASIKAVIAAENSVLSEPMRIKISRVYPDPNNPRKHFDPERLRELADSIQAKGQETPANVTADPDVTGQFMLVSGERRLRALKIIWERLGGTPETEPTIMCFISVLEGGSHERLLHAFMENENREEMCALDKASALAELHRGGESITDLAEVMSFSEAQTKNYIALDSLTDEVKDLMDPSLPDSKQLKVTTAIDLTHVKSPALQLELAQEAIDLQLTTSEARYRIEVRGGIGVKGLVRAGHERSPHTRYLMLTRFVGRTQSWLNDFMRHGRDPIDEAFFHRDGEDEDRRALAAKIKVMIRKLENLLDIIEHKPKNPDGE